LNGRRIGEGIELRLEAVVVENLQIAFKGAH
jgi:hypothetical protein